MIKGNQSPAIAPISAGLAQVVVGGSRSQAERGQRAWQLAQAQVRENVETAYTIGIDTPQLMAAKAAQFHDAPLPTIKLGG